MTGVQTCALPILLHNMRGEDDVSYENRGRLHHQKPHIGKRKAALRQRRPNLPPINPIRRCKFPTGRIWTVECSAGRKAECKAVFVRDWQDGLWLRERPHIRERGCKAEKGTEGHRRCDLRKELQYIIWKRSI